MNRIWKALAASFIAVSASAYTIKETKSNTDLDLYTSPSGTPAKAVSVSGTSGFLAALFGLQVNTQTQLTGALSTPMLQVDKTSNGTMMLHRESADAGGGTFEMLKRRSGFNVVTSGDRIGTLAFSAADGTAAREAASVIAEVDGVPGASNMPGRLIFRTNVGAVAPTERMRIDSAGKVGIGTTSPDYPFETESGASDWVGRFINTSATGFGLQVTGASNSSSQEIFKVRKNTIDDAFIVLGNGNVGIGTGAPTAKLQVSGATRTTALFTTGANGRPGFFSTTAGAGVTCSTQCETDEIGNGCNNAAATKCLEAWDQGGGSVVGCASTTNSRDCLCMCRQT